MGNRSSTTNNERDPTGSLARRLFKQGGEEKPSPGAAWTESPQVAHKKKEKKKNKNKKNPPPPKDPHNHPLSSPHLSSSIFINLSSKLVCRSVINIIDTRIP